MPYFLDGNNLIGLARKTGRPGEDDRSALLAEISERLRTTRSSVHLFFDGGGRGLSLGNLTVSDSGGSADDAIVRELAAAKDPGQVTVVTADRGLSSRVRDLGGKTMAPDEFWKRFGTRTNREEIRGDARVDVDDWMDYFSDPKNRNS